MTILAHHLGSFLLEYLPRDRGVSQHTIDSYAYSFQLLVNYTANRYSIRPHAISIEHLTAQLILDFLDYLECERGNTARTRNARLAAYKSFFRYLEWRAPKCLEQIRQIHAIPAKKFDLALVDYLDRKEMQAILDTPDRSSVGGLRDRAMLHLVYAAGLRVSELIGLTMADFSCPALDEVHVIGKGRRERVLPLWNETRAVLKNWLEVRPNHNTSAFILNARGGGNEPSWFCTPSVCSCKTGCRSGSHNIAKKHNPSCHETFLCNAHFSSNRGYQESFSLVRTQFHENYGNVSSG